MLHMPEGNGWWALSVRGAACRLCTCCLAQINVAGSGNVHDELPRARHEKDGELRCRRRVEQTIAVDKRDAPRTAKTQSTLKDVRITDHLIDATEK